MNVMSPAQPEVACRRVAVHVRTLFLAINKNELI